MSHYLKTHGKPVLFDSSKDGNLTPRSEPRAGGPSAGEVRKKRQEALDWWGYEPVCEMCEEEKADAGLSQDLAGVLEDRELSCDDPRVCSQDCFDSAFQSAIESLVL